MVTLTTAARDAAVNGVVDLIDAGSADANGDLVIRDGSNTELAVLAFSNPAFGASSGGTASANSIASDTSATAGVAANFIVRDRDNTLVFDGTVGTSGTDLTLSSTTIGSGDTVSMSTFDVSIAAS